MPETHLARIIRLTATAGFLDESQPGHVAHTALSAPFVTDPSFLDAAMFLADSAAPAVLQMQSATQKFGDSHRSNETAYNLAANTITPFHDAREQRPKLNRQWSAYLYHAGGLHTADNISEILTQLNWSNASNTRIVEVTLYLSEPTCCLVIRTDESEFRLAQSQRQQLEALRLNTRVSTLSCSSGIPHPPCLAQVLQSMIGVV